MPSARSGASADRLDPRRDYDALPAVPSTLRIPLAARAFGDALFPEVAVEDAWARPVMDALGDDGQAWLADEGCVYGVLARTRQFRATAQAFLSASPQGEVVNLGCGLSNYAQWLGDGQARMVDADLPEVLCLRERLLPPLHGHHRHRVLDMRSPDWWAELALPVLEGPPVCLICEGVLMYLEPAQVHAMLRTFGASAPPGSVLVFDALCWLTIGQARMHPLVRLTGAEFTWGPRGLAELTSPHPRLRLSAVHQVMDGFSSAHSFVGSAFRFMTGIPFYAVYELRVDDLNPAPPDGR